MLKIILTAFLLGLSFGSGPCLASCGPLLISYIAGTGKNLPKSIITYSLFSLSRICAYLIAALLIFFCKEMFFIQKLEFFSRYLFIFGGLFILVTGILLVIGKNINQDLCHRLQGTFLERDKKTILIFGLITGFLPCAPLISVVVYLGLVSGSWITNLIYTLSFGIGTALSPLFLVAMLSGFVPRLIKTKDKLYYFINLICGLIIIFLGVQLIRHPAISDWPVHISM